MVKKYWYLPIFILIICIACNKIPQENKNIEIQETVKNQNLNEQKEIQEKNIVSQPQDNYKVERLNISEPNYSGKRTLLLISQFYDGEIDSTEYCFYDPIENKLYKPDYFKDSLKDTTICISNNKERLLIVEDDFKKKNIKIINIDTKETIFTTDAPSLPGYLPYRFSPLLTGYVEKNQDGYYFHKLNGSSKIRLPIEQNIYLDRDTMQISPDEKYIAYVYNAQDEYHLSTIDIEDGKILCNLVMKENIYLSQFHESGKVLFETDSQSYIIDYDGNNKKDLGKDIIGPMLSPDRKIIAFNKVVDNKNEELLEEDIPKNYDIYIWDFESNKKTRVPQPMPQLIDRFETIEQWIENINVAFLKQKALP